MKQTYFVKIDRFTNFIISRVNVVIYNCNFISITYNGNSCFRCPDSGPRATRMPTDDDYGRRDRLLLHQHPITQYGSSSSPLCGSNTPSSNNVVGLQIGSNNPNDCFKQQAQQQQQQQQQQSSDLHAITNTASQLGSERYQSDQQIQSNEHVGTRMVDRHEKSAEKTIDFSKCGESRPSSCDRFGHYQAQSGEHATSRMGVERYEKATDKPSVDYTKCGEVRQSNCERYGHYQTQNSDQAHMVGARMSERHEKSPPSDKSSIDFTKCVDRKSVV